jgi:hypothetical protein
MVRCLTLSLALVLLLHLVKSNNVAIVARECPTVIKEAYGREELDQVLSNTFGRVIWMTKERASPGERASLEECLAMCRTNSECKKAILKFDMMWSNTRKFLLVVKIGFKILVAHKRLSLLDLPIASACDLLQFWLHVEYPILERVVGFVGNSKYGVAGLLLWLYSEFFYYK